jgi:hypothetical protein
MTALFFEVVLARQLAFYNQRQKNLYLIHLPSPFVLDENPDRSDSIFSRAIPIHKIILSNRHAHITLNEYHHLLQVQECTSLPALQVLYLAAPTRAAL